MTTTRKESIANADAHLNNAGLPTYSELREALIAIDARINGRWNDPCLIKYGAQPTNTIDAIHDILSSVKIEGF